MKAVIVDLTLHALAFGTGALMIWMLFCWCYYKIRSYKTTGCPSPAPDRRRLLVQSCFVFYLAALIHITVIRNGIHIFPLNQHTLDSVSLMPLVDLVALAERGFWPFAYMFVGNLIWFVPIGIFLSVGTGFRAGPGSTMFWGFTVSLSIECLQWLFDSGVSDVDDLILNTLGALIGWALARLCRRMISRFPTASKSR